MNQTIFQFFHWYNSPEDNLWQLAVKEAPRLAKLGVTDVWLPPAYKSAHGVNEPGYAVYDMYDLGEFDQKETVRTRYGTKDEYLAAIKAFHDAGIRVLADVVFNHRVGADEQEKVIVQTVNEHNRNETITEPHEIDAFTKFYFPGRKGKYSEFVWDKTSFTGNCEAGAIEIFLHEYTNGTWDDVPENEKGNFDYLMGTDVEFRNPYVREELKRWGCWYAGVTGVDGFRLDALKHINHQFFPEWIAHLEECFKKGFPVIGEFWKADVGSLLEYIEFTNNRIRLFDVPLHFTFFEVSKSPEIDLRSIFNDTLAAARPDMAITFVDNHDTQPLQALESTVDFWFKHLAYAMILLREQGTPCVFYPDLYESHHDAEKDGASFHIDLAKVDWIDHLMIARKDLAYGFQRDYFDEPQTIGWTREGADEFDNSGCAVIVSIHGNTEKWMSMGTRNAGKKYVNILNNDNRVELNENGEGMFTIADRQLAVYALEDYQVPV